jgi:hypothetical protein
VCVCVCVCVCVSLFVGKQSVCVLVCVCIFRCVRVVAVINAFSFGFSSCIPGSDYWLDVWQRERPCRKAERERETERERPLAGDLTTPWVLGVNHAFVVHCLCVTLHSLGGEKDRVCSQAAA